eukprot:1160509-Pelagomonas_calceolata.AAC.3
MPADPSHLDSDRPSPPTHHLTLNKPKLAHTILMAASAQDGSLRYVPDRVDVPVGLAKFM